MFLTHSKIRLFVFIQYSVIIHKYNQLKRSLILPLIWIGDITSVLKKYFQNNKDKISLLTNFRYETDFFFAEVLLV